MTKPASAAHRRDLPGEPNLLLRERDAFADDVLERLVRSNRDYQNEHGHYIVPLAARLLEARAEIKRLRDRQMKLLALVGDGDD